jgi:hypothetical protein
VEDGPAQHLAALERVRFERIESEARELIPALTKFPDAAVGGTARRF